MLLLLYFWFGYIPNFDGWPRVTLRFNWPIPNLKYPITLLSSPLSDPKPPLLKYPLQTRPLAPLPFFPLLFSHLTPKPPKNMASHQKIPPVVLTSIVLAPLFVSLLSSSFSSCLIIHTTTSFNQISKQKWWDSLKKSQNKHNWQSQLSLTVFLLHFITTMNTGKISTDLGQNTTALLLLSFSKKKKHHCLTPFLHFLLLIFFFFFPTCWI